MLDGDSLRAFIAVAELQHFVRAADRLDVVQSVVSKRLMRLEDVLGARLIHRGKRSRVTLTQAGGLFLPEARLALESLERAEALGRKFARGAAGPLRMGYVFSAVTTGILPRIVRHVAADLPDIEFHPVALETPEQIAAVAKGDIDFGVCRPRPTYPEGVIARVIHAEGIVAAIALDHPLARVENLRASDIVGQRIFVPQFHEDVGIIDVIREIASMASAPLPALHKTSDFIAAAGLAASATGIAVTPRSLARLNLDGLIFRDIADFAVELQLVLVMRTDIAELVASSLATVDWLG